MFGWPERVVVVLIAVTFCPLFLLTSLINANEQSYDWMWNILVIEKGIFFALILPIWAMMRALTLIRRHPRA